GPGEGRRSAGLSIQDVASRCSVVVACPVSAHWRWRYGDPLYFRLSENALGSFYYFAVVPSASSIAHSGSVSYGLLLGCSNVELCMVLESNFSYVCVSWFL
uniref:Uncharacterized protein n=1 Tax=Aegilops tauschii subsp. strangulata TaxID=200361 RepID=A0A452XT64_AEGTS